MKRNLLFAAILAIAGVWTQSAWAQAPTFAGWTQVESLDDLDNVDGNYYVVLDAVSNGGFAMVNGGGEFYYQTTADPNVVDGEVWIIEKDGEYINFKSMLDGRYINTGNAGWNFNHNSTTKETANFTPTLADGVWTFQAAAFGGNNYMGPWDGTISVSSSDGQARFAYNKATSDTHTFLLYSMPRTTYATVHAAAVDYNAKGWKAAQAAADLAVDGNYYIVVDGRSGEYLMSSGRSRPSFMAYNNPLTNKNMLWTMSPYGEKYNFKNEDTGKYLRCYDNGWDTGFSDSNNNDDKAFTLTLANGKWNIQRTSDYMFTWRGGSEKPYQTAYIAGNKSASDNAGWYIYSLPSALGTSYAQALPADGTMAADTWYFFDNEFANDFTVTADNLADIVYVMAGATTAAFTENADGTVSLVAGRYYIKSSSANSFTYEASSYSYSISAATTNPADGSIIKAGQTITVTYTAQTDDPNMTLTKDFTGVTFGGSAVAFTETDNGFTFEVPATVTAAESYELAIPAGAVSYGNEASSAAASFFYSTPVLADGVYYFRNTDPNYEYKYISRGGSWSTQAIAGDFGLATYISINEEGKTYIQFYDNERYLGDTGFMYTDCAASSGRQVLFTVEKVDGGYKFKRDATNYLALYQGQVVADGREGDNLEGTTNIWALETTAEYTPTYARNAAKQVQAAVDAAGIEATVTTGAELEALFGFSKAIEIPEIARSRKLDGYAPETSGGGVYNYFNEQTVTGLAKGIYKLKFHAYQRGASFRRVDQAEGARGLIYGYANNAQTQIISVMDEGASTAYSSDYPSTRTGLHYPNDSGSSYTSFDNGLYWNEIYVYVSDGTLKFGMVNPSRLGENCSTYAVWGDFSLTYFYNDLTGPWRDALAAAKETAAKTDRMAPSLRTALETTIATYDEGEVDETSQEDLDTATAALIAATAKAETSIASYAVIAQGFVPDNSLEGWTCETFVAGQDVRFQVNTWSHEGDSGNDPSGMVTPFIENWTPGGNLLGEGKVYYRLEGLEPGEVYRVEALVRSYNEASAEAPNGPNFYVLDDVADLSEVGTTFTYNNMSGIYGTQVAAATIGQDGVLELGIVVASNRNYNWVAFKNIKIATYDASLAAAIARVEALEEKVPAGAYAIAYAVVTANTGENYPKTAEQFETAIEALNQAADNLEQIAEAFSKFLELKAIAEFNRDAESDADEADAQDYAGQITTAQTAVDAATSVADVEAANAQLKADMIAYVNANNPVGDSKFKMTFMLTNPNLDGIPAWTGGVDGWYTDQTFSTQNFQTMDEGDTGKMFMEYWSAGSNATEGFVLYQQLTLPEGTYQMTAECKAGWGSGASAQGGMKNITFSANETDGSQITSDLLAPAQIEFVNATEGNVQIGLKAHEGNTCNWMGIGYVELYKIPAQAYEIGGDAWDPATEGAGDVTIARSINVGYNAYILPFNMTQAEVEEVFGEGSTVKVVRAFDAENEILKFSTREGIAANEPCIVKATAAATAGTVVIPNRTLVPATASDIVYTGEGLTMTGCYAKETDVPLYSLFVQSAKLVYNESSAFIYSTRTYITLEGWEPGENGIKGLTIIDDDEATGIAVVENGQLNLLTGKVYDLSGRAVKNPTKGLYIIDGKKVMLK